MRFKYFMELVGRYWFYEDCRLDNFIEYWSVVVLFMFYEFILGLECYCVLIENFIWLYICSFVSKFIIIKIVV